MSYSFDVATFVSVIVAALLYYSQSKKERKQKASELRLQGLKGTIDELHNLIIEGRKLMFDMANGIIAIPQNRDLIAEFLSKIERFLRVSVELRVAIWAKQDEKQLFEKMLSELRIWFNNYQNAVQNHDIVNVPQLNDYLDLMMEQTQRLSQAIRGELKI